ncbi:unnamed protein product [Durusdinium trenchii]|uniref:Uncharacterized protein n=1 Tax=Durusdinium trenchii TaxID=1381693 RepID=A0ABP0SB12_9DINO
MTGPVNALRCRICGPYATPDAAARYRRSCQKLGTNYMYLNMIYRIWGDRLVVASWLLNLLLNAGMTWESMNPMEQAISFGVTYFLATRPTALSQLRGFFLMLAFDSLYHVRAWIMLMLNIIQLLFSVMCILYGTSFGLPLVVRLGVVTDGVFLLLGYLSFPRVVATGIQSVASVMELALHNADDYPIEWKIQTDSLGKFKGVFTVDPQSGILHPAQDCLVRAAFLPSEPIEYKANVNVYISPPRSTAVDAGKSLDPSLALNADESKPYLALRMKGQGTVPKLTFDRREIVLPIVPLGIRSRCLFYIVNEGYESLDVQYRLPNDQIRIPLTINFPEGQQIGITKPKIPVEIFFQSNKPISFCAKIEFLDNESGSYVLPVSGTTENCILTCHHYLHNNTDFYTLEGEPVMLQEKEDNSGNEQGAAPSIKTGSVSHNSMAGYGNQEGRLDEWIDASASASWPRLSLSSGSTCTQGLRDLHLLLLGSASIGFRPLHCASRRICMSAQAALHILIEAVQASARALRGLADNLERAAAAAERGPAAGSDRVTEVSTDTIDWDLVTEALEAERDQRTGASGTNFSSYHDVEKSIPPLPDHCVDLCGRLGGTIEDVKSRATRAWIAGCWAKATLEGKIPKPRPTPKIALQATTYIILKGPGVQRPTRVSSAAEYFKLLPRFENSVSRAVEMATGGPIQFLDQGVLQTYVMGLDLTAWDGEWTESFAIPVLSRQSGVLIAVPEGAFSPEVLQAGAFAAMDDLVGPSTRVTLPAVFEELDGTETPHTEEIPVVLIDFHKNILESIRGFDPVTEGPGIRCFSQPKAKASPGGASTPKRVTTATLAEQLAEISKVLPAMSSQLEAMTQRQDRVERLMSSAPQASSKEPPAHKQDFPLVGKGSPRPSALKFVSRVGSPPRSRPLADASPAPRKTVEFTNVDEPLALPSDPDYPGGEQSVPVLPQPEALSAALFQQSQALTTLVAHLAGQDGMEFGSTGTSSALSLKGSLKRDKPSEPVPQEISALGGRALFSKYMERSGGYSGQRDLGLTMWLLSQMADAFLNEDAAGAQELLALTMVTLEQVAQDSGKWEVGWILSLQEDPPPGVFQARPIATNPRLRAFAPLCPPEWATTALSYVKEVDLINSRRQEALPGKKNLPGKEQDDQVRLESPFAALFYLRTARLRLDRCLRSGGSPDIVQNLLCDVLADYLLHHKTASMQFFKSLVPVAGTSGGLTNPPGKKAYADAGLEGSPLKDLVDEEKGKIIGAEVDSSSLTRSLGLVLVAAPVRKRLALAYISLELAAKDTTSDALHACLIGGWVSAAMYRRPFMSILQKAYKIQMSEHKRIQIAGKWSKPSAVYTDELAAALGQSFDKALTKKIRRTQFVEPKLKGLESPLCNDVLLSAKWKVDKVWSWRSPKHINIQEVLAAERLMKEQAVSWPKSRFPVVVDSNVGMSALVKGRSPSDGLRPALRRAGSTIVAGALYPAYHFGPTRLLPADHPTPENEFPPPCRSCLPPEATCAELLQFSKVSNLARKGANWVRLVLLLLQNLPLWSLSKDSWRFAHVNYKHYPFSTQKADFSRKEFDSARGYPGEGPTAGGSRVQLIRCLASVLPFGFPALVGLLGAFAALVGIFGAYISLAAFGLTSALPRKAVPVHVRSRFRPRSSSLTLFRQAKLQALFLAILFLEHPGLVAGAPRHGLKLQPRDAADRARQETRDQLELPDGRPVLGQTQRQRDKLMGAFEEWLRSQGILLDEILMVGAPDVEALNILLERYGRELYRAGRPYGHYSETVNAVSAKRPRVRRLLQPAWDLAYSWLRQEPPVHHLALPWQAMLSFLTTSLCWGWCRVAGIIALSWGGITRIGESVNAFRRDLVLPSDVNYTIDYVLLQIAEPKTRFRCARHQMAKVDQPQLVRIIVTAFENLRPDQRLWPASGSTIRSRFQRLVQANSLDHLRTKKGLDLGSLRAGGASWLLMTSDNPDMTRRRGRWINAKVMEVYVQEAWAVQFLPQLPKSIKEGIMEGAGLFPWALELAEIWKRAAVPESAWPILYQKAARDLEQQEMGRQHLEKEEAGDGGAAFAQCGRVHPSKDAEEKKCDQLDELTFNSECPVRRSSFSRKAAHPSNILKNQLDHFPQDLVNSNGRHLYEMIEFLSGKSVPNKAAAPPPQRMDNTGSSFRGNDRGAKQKSREMQKILQLMQQYEVLLNFLKQHGALLSSVRPEHFLSHEYYLQYQQSLNVGITRRQVDKIFFPKSMEAWLTSLLQTVKIFLLNRVTHKAFKTLPGMSAEVDQPVGAPVGVDDMDLEVEKKNSPELQGALDQKFLADSNVYSISECILLRWLNFHFARANRDRYSPRKVCCFDSDLEDSIVLAVVIQSHVPHCQAVQNMRPQCSNLDHHEENAMHILAALSEIGLQFPIQVSDIASPQAKDMLLFVMFLFQNLPHYVPKTTIIFSTMLGVNMTKNIELTNPSKKAISYGVQLVGSGHNSGSDFAIKDEIVKLEPRQTVSFPVEFHSRFSRIVDEKIIFTSRREGNVNAAAMVFKLRSRCTGRKPRKTIQVSAVLYEVGTVDVELENPFNEDAEFSVALRESTCCDAEKHPLYWGDHTLPSMLSTLLGVMRGTPSNVLSIAGKEWRKKNARVASKRSEGMEAFYLSVTRCRVKAGGTGKITVSFLPFEAPAHFTALLGVFDSKAGEYYYELFGTSSPPLPLENYKMQVKAEASGTKDIILPLRNMQVERARSWLESRGAGPRPLPPDYIVYDVKVSSPYYTAPKQVVVHNGQAVNREVAPLEKSLNGSGEDLYLSQLRVEQVPDEVTGGPSPFYLMKYYAWTRQYQGDRRSSAVAKAIGLPQQVAKLVVEFWPKEPGVYPCTVTLTSDIDIRIYQFEGTGTAPNTHCSLTFTTQARKAITQEIPIVNPTDREWAIKPTFSQIGHEFDGPREFIAKKKGATGQATVTTYPLTFKPDWVCDVKAQLVLYNVGTNETYELRAKTAYDLHGVAEEPLAEEHVVVKCEAREKTSHVFQVKNHSNLTAAFEVESDLVHISGPSSIQVDGRGTGDYELTFQPLQAGQVTGCIIFRDTHTGHFTWYTVELMTLPPKPQQHLTLTCVVRQAVAVDIQLVNPLDDVVVFEVALTGDGLLGEAEFVLAPKETATYELVFSPLLPARSKGTAVFFNEIVGEFWYDLSLLAEAAPAEEIAPLECELGRTAQTVVHIDNPTGQEVVLKHRSTNKINFKVLNNRVVLPPLESTDITIEYSPSSLGVTEEAQIVFEHPLVGQWVYKAQGLGLPPLEARHVTVAAQVNRTVSSTIQFKNPFLETITIFIVLESKSEKGVFNLLSKKAKVQIGPLATTQIPFSFCPPTMTQHTAEIALSVMKPNLSWSYRIQGVAEAPADPTLHTFMVQAREALQTTYALTLIGLDTTPGDTHGDQLSCQLEVPPQHQAMVSKCFDISLDSDATAARASSQASRTRGKSDGQVFLKVNFSPLRPFIALCNLVITRASGGRWRFDLKLEATEPEVDDVISIQSPLNKPASVAFRLNNHTSVYSEFEAFFDAESAYEFTVQPTSGVLEPAGTNGTTFVVTYKPTEYGKPVQGKLIIQTEATQIKSEDVFWSYLVKGTHPKYTAPVVEKPKVATRLTKEMEMQLAKASQSRRKNFIKETWKRTFFAT